MSNSTKKILLAFDEQMLLDARKILFSNGVTIQQFATNAFHRLSLQKEDAMSILEDTKEKNKEIMSGDDKEKIAKLDSKALYDFFEVEEKKT